jgi:hypothetical protein
MLDIFVETNRSVNAIARRFLMSCRPPSSTSASGSMPASRPGDGMVEHTALSSFRRGAGS